MVFLYDLGLLFYTLIIRIASLKNKKAQKWLEGRKNLFEHIQNSVDSSKKHIWFHFASLGEFEQGRTVIEELIKLRPQSNLIITFFSPSGYEVRKNYPLAKHVFYLPLDTRQNAEQFIRLINPEVAVFTKYEYWYHYFKILKRNEIPLFMISTIFRPNQIFFKWYGGLHRKILGFVTHFFVQNLQSCALLKEIAVTNATVSGDTRFDRVYENATRPKRLELVEKFVTAREVLIGGSTWAEDEALLAELASENPSWKFIIAPHEIQQVKIESIENTFTSTIRYSRIAEFPEEQLGAEISDKQTLIIDNIGMLSSLYQYGKIAFIGGGFGAGIHNTLEAAAFGLPVVFGPKFQKFQEAKDLIQVGAGFTVASFGELNKVFTSFKDRKALAQSSLAARTYVNENTGATKLILERVIKSLS